MTAGGGLREEFLLQRPMLLRMLAARLRSAEEAEDVVQELWLKLQREASGPVGQPGAYLFRMASNLALDRRRSELRRSAREAGWLSVQPAASEYADAERVLLASDRLKQVQAALAAMPERTRMAFRLYRLEGLPRPRIAERMGISVSAVEKLLHRAYRHIEDFCAEGGVESAPPRHLGTMGVFSNDD